MPATQLPKSGLNKQDLDDDDWHLPLNSGFDTWEARIGLTASGDPNGNVAGNYIGQICYDTVNNAFYLCTSVGTASAAGWQRNSGGGQFKGENGTVGASPGDIFRINEKVLNTDVTIASGENASCTGPLTVASGVTLTVNGTLVIL